MSQTPVDIDPASADAGVGQPDAGASGAAGDPAHTLSSQMVDETTSLVRTSAEILPFPRSGDAGQRGRLPGEEALHRRLASFNAIRWKADLPGTGWSAQLQEDLNRQLQEGRFIESERRDLRRELMQLPHDADGVLRWWTDQSRPSATDPLLAQLATEVTLDQMRWFLRQELAALRYQDEILPLLALRLPMPGRLLLSQAHWDDLGQGDIRLSRTAHHQRLMLVLRLEPAEDDALWEVLALSNLMVGLAAHRRYAYQALGALAMQLMVHPLRCQPVDEGLRRLGISAPARLCLSRDAQHARERTAQWRDQLLEPLLTSDPRIPKAFLEGGLLWLRWRQRCDSRYRRALQVSRLN